MAWRRFGQAEGKLPLWMRLCTVVVAVGSAVGAAAAISTLQSDAAERLRAETRVVALEGVAWGMQGVYSSLLLGGPTDRLHRAHVIISDMVAEEDAALRRLDHEAVTQDFREAHKAFRAAMDAEWARVLTSGPTEGFAADIMTPLFNRVVDLSQSTRKALSDRGALDLREVRILTGAILIAGAFIALAVLAFAHRVLRNAAVRIAHERALAQAERRYRSISGNAEEMLTIMSADGRLMWASPTFERVFGWKLEDRIGRRVGRFVHPEDLPRVSREYAHVAAQPGAAINQQYRAKDANGNWHWIGVTLTNQTGDPDIGGIVWTAHLIDAQKDLEQKMMFGLSHDNLTGLPNRGAFTRMLAGLNVAADSASFAVLNLDLDDFKRVNNGLGQAAGDALLVRVARRLRAWIGSGDTVARLGGNEFAILASAAGREELTHLADHLGDLIKDPFQIAGHDVFIRCSIGLAFVQGPEVEADAVIRDAHLAMLAAKRSGKGRYAIFEARMRIGLGDSIQIEADLRRALLTNEIVVHYQPIVDLATSHVHTVEALTRWQHPDQGLLAPALFFDLAERTGLIVPIGRFVIREACRQVADWRSARPGASDLRLAVNLSSTELRSPDITADILRACEDAKLPPEALTIEVTETVLTEDVAEVAVVLRQLKEHHVRISIDDFGTGYSSLSHLRSFPVDELKIDRSFVDGVDTSDDLKAMVRAVVKLANDLSLHTVAEGVETPTQQQVIRDLGCDYAQGYLYAPALAPDALAALFPVEVGNGLATLDAAAAH